MGSTFGPEGEGSREKELILWVKLPEDSLVQQVTMVNLQLRLGPIADHIGSMNMAVGISRSSQGS